MKNGFNITLCSMNYKCSNFYDDPSRTLKTYSFLKNKVLSSSLIKTIWLKKLKSLPFKVINFKDRYSITMQVSTKLPIGAIYYQKLPSCFDRVLNN